MAVALLGRSGAHRAISVGLGLLWVWSGVLYDWWHFTAINRPAWGFGALFVIQGVPCPTTMLALALGLGGQSPGEYIESRDPVSGTVYGLSLLLFALMPTVVTRHSSHTC